MSWSWSSSSATHFPCECSRHAALRHDIFIYREKSIHTFQILSRCGISWDSSEDHKDSHYKSLVYHWSSFGDGSWTHCGLSLRGFLSPAPYWTELWSSSWGSVVERTFWSIECSYGADSGTVRRRTVLLKNVPRYQRVATPSTDGLVICSNRLSS